MVDGYRSGKDWMARILASVASEVTAGRVGFIDATTAARMMLVLAVPDQLAIAKNFLDAMQRHVVYLARLILDAHGKVLIRREMQLAKRDANDLVFDAIVVTKDEFRATELGVPSDTIQEFVYRRHGVRP
jgi:hypothetical protein